MASSSAMFFSSLARHDTTTLFIVDLGIMNLEKRVFASGRASTMAVIRSPRRLLNARTAAAGLTSPSLSVLGLEGVQRDTRE